MPDTPWTTSQKIDRTAKATVSAEAMMAYTRNYTNFVLSDYDRKQADEDAATATKTLFYHSLWIMVGASTSAVMIAMGCDIYLSIAVGAIVSLCQEIWDKIKGTG
jgi:hypothetical protein